MSDADERLIVMLEARIAEFEKRMAQAERRGTRTYTGLSRGSRAATRQMEADMLSATARINAALSTTSAKIGAFGKAFAVGLAAGAIGQLASSARSAVTQMADLADEADRIGMSAENLQGLKAGFKLAGVEAGEAASSLEVFAQRLGDAADGQGDLYAVLERSGIAIRTQTGELRSTLDVMKDFAGLVQSAGSASERMALVTDAFGRGGKAMVLAMSEGSDGIDAMIERAREAGIIIEEDVIRRAAELDDKFDQVAQTLDAGFKRAVVSAAEFFNFIDSEADRLAKEEEERRQANLLGSNLATALKEDAAAARDAAPALQDLETVYSDLQGAVTALDNALSGDITTLVDLGASEAAIELADVVDEMGNLVYQVRQGKVPASELEAKMTELITRADTALQSVQGIDGVDLSGAVAAVDRVSGALQVAIGWAAGLVGQMNAIAGLSMDTGAGLTGAEGNMPPSEGQMDSSIRPRKPPPLLGEVDTGSGGGRGGGGGGGGSSRIEALLQELQTEREVLEAWYEESLELLNGATDAQLEALGGRHEAMERLEAEHMERLREIRDDGQGGMLADAETFFGEMASAAALGGEKLVRTQRVFAAAEALINTYRAQSQVLADPTLPWWRKIPAAFAIGAAGMGFVAAIKGGGKSSGGGSSGGGGNTAETSASKSEGPLRVLLEGIEDDKRYEGAAIRRMYDAIMKEAGDRGVTFVRAGS